MRIDCHLHTEYSKDSMSSLENLLKRAHEIGLGRLIITDHDTIRGALVAKEIEPDFVIIGQEIKTDGGGEILGYYVQEEIPKWLPPREAFERLKAQGAFISLAHPFAAGRMHWTREQITEYREYLDAIEIANGRNSHERNRSAAEFAASLGLCGTAGSDGHSVKELGRIGLELPEFDDPESMRAAVKEAQIFGKESGMFVRLYSREAVLLKKFGFVRQK